MKVWTVGHVESWKEHCSRVNYRKKTDKIPTFLGHRPMKLSESKELWTGSPVAKHVGRPGCCVEGRRKIRDHFNKLSEAKCGLPYQSGIAVSPDTGGVCMHLQALFHQPSPGAHEKSWAQGGRPHGALLSIAGLQEVIGSCTGTAQSPASFLKGQEIYRVRLRDFK